ncbi:MAG: tetratricopeptide repeat protein [Spirochaetes bacterium]|nr:tetratricopeptide repeat protein [Spirochaetota bacterium]
MKIKIDTLRPYYPVVILLSGLVIFSITAAPDVTGEDSGEIIASSYFLGIGHPPGYPLYYLLARLFSCWLLPLTLVLGSKGFSMAYRLNLLSGFFTTLSMFTLYFFIRNILQWAYRTSSRKENPGFQKYFSDIACIASLMLGSLDLIWSQSTRSEVYSLNLLLIILNFFVFFRFQITGKIKYIRLFAFLYGLNIIAHQSSIIFAPVFILWLFFTRRDILKNKILMLGLCGLFLLSSSLYFYMPLRSMADPPLNWGRTSHINNFIHHLFRDQYHTRDRTKDQEILKADRTLTAYVTQIGQVLKIMIQNFTLPVFILLLIGFYELYRKQKKYFLFIVLSSLFFLVVMTFVANFRITDLSLYVSQVFYIPLLFTMLLALPFAIIFIARHYTDRVIRYFFIIPVVLFFVNFNRNNQHDNIIIADHIRNILSTIKKQGILFVMGDNITFPMAYYYYAAYLRPDVTVMGEYGNVFQNSLKKYVNRIPAKREDLMDLNDRVKDDITAGQRNDIYLTYASRAVYPERKLVPYGLIYRLARTKQDERLDDYTYLHYCLESASGDIRDIMDRDMASVIFFRLGKYFENIGVKELAVRFHARSKLSLGTELIRKRIHYGWALDYKKRSSFDKAIFELERALQIDPEYSMAYSLLGDIYSEQGYPEKAISEYQKAIRFDTVNSELYNKMGAEYYKIKQKKSALESYKKAMELDPLNYKAYNNLAILFKDQGKFNEAIDLYLKAIRINSDYEEAYYNLGTLYLQMGDIDRSFVNLQKAVRLYPEYVAAHYNLGILFQKRKEYKKAIPYFKKAVKLQPDFDNAFYNVGICYLWINEYERAEKYFKKCIRINASHYSAYKHLGNTYYYLKDLNQAYKVWKKAYRLNPDDKELENNLNALRARGVQ